MIRILLLGYLCARYDIRVSSTSLNQSWTKSWSYTFPSQLNRKERRPCVVSAPK